MIQENSITCLALPDLHEIKTLPSQKLFVLFDKTRRAVSGVILIELPEGESFAKFGLFALDNSCRGTKLGRKMVAFVERCARENKRDTMKIEVFTFAKGLAKHYQSLGYAFTGVEKSFFHSGCIQERYRNSTGLYLQEMSKDLSS